MPHDNLVSVTTAERDDDDQWWVVTRDPDGVTISARAASDAEAIDLDEREAGEAAANVPLQDPDPDDPVVQLVASLTPEQRAALLAALSAV